MVYYFTDDTFAVRKSLDDSFDEKKIREQVTDTGIQKILLKHLEENGNDPKIAFSPDGIERLNANLTRLNNGRKHKPIYKIRWYESASKFAVGKIGNKTEKYVEAAKGTNLYFAVYSSKEGMRSFDTIPLNEVIERLKNRLFPVPEINRNGDRLLFYLSPNDLVYLPTAGEIAEASIEAVISERIYKTVSSSGSQCFFVNSRVATSIVNKVEFSPLNKMERAITGEMIKEICVPLKVDRLGNIIYIGTEFLPKRD
jgi:CRISPR-associated endonuclease Csn1